MKPIHILALSALLFALAGCSVPVSVSAGYTDPETGLTVSGGYSSKGGLVIEATK